MSNSPFSFLNLDVFSRTDSEYRVRTKSGAIISIVAILVITFLFISELSIYLKSDITPELYVDTSLGGKIQINLNISFPSMPCAFISVNAMDKTGNYQLDIHHDIFTTRIDKNGIPMATDPEREVVGFDNKETVDVDLAAHESEQQGGCLSCFGAETEDRPCCNTCEEVKEAYRKKGWAMTDAHKVAQCVKEGFVHDIKGQKDEGCMVHGFLKVNRVYGNLNIVPGKLIVQNSRYVVDSDLYRLDKGFNMSHVIHQFSFGKDYPGMKNPLEGVAKASDDSSFSNMYQYFVKVVPTIYTDIYGNVINTNQYSVEEASVKISNVEYAWGSSGVPGFFVMYDLSPITVDYKESNKSFLHFLTNLCAIIGGVYTVASLVDSFLYSGLHTLKSKIELKKQF